METYEDLIDKWSNIQAADFGANDVPTEKSSKLLVFVMVLNCNGTLDIVPFWDSKKLSKVQIKQQLQEMLELPNLSVNILTISSNYKCAGFKDEVTCKEYFAEQVSTRNYKKLETDKDISDNTCYIHN
ncbi:hypothetical protein COEREDRAFT_89779 [Coemansia reversa NRRL 1564]|uniref:Uncharacterized protein n=1 Tax=Coemansia reversa (strain ATCC 12441 / NRRL 1564) TaxID=763665 RepID=A0A2G5B2F6_COERN|nr:hypothetical protein COEREDRAFT_89779 [Coemansia reversa NRRL 1564]|eukprot:PIA13202.1 hypothetical protein COEREDRAFT_89779 [Coemansia reversa NRRL 1564]